METRILWWNIHDYPHYKEIFYTFFIISFIFFVYGFYLKIKNWSRGRSISQKKDTFAQIKDMLIKSLTYKHWAEKSNKHNKERSLVAAAHGFVFYGFFILWIGTEILTVQDKVPTYFFQGPFYKAYSLMMDLSGLVMLLGLSVFAYIRYVKKPKRLDNYQKDWIQLVYLSLFIILGFLIEGLRQSATNQIEPFAPVGALVATLANNLSYENKKTLHLIIWWTHSLQTFSFIALIPYTKFSHMFIAPANLYFSKLKPSGALPTPFNLVEIMAMDNPPDDFAQTVNKIEDFTWKDLMDLDACTACGRCQDLCPASNSEKPLSPKWVMLDLKQIMYGKSPSPHGYRKSQDNNPEGNIALSIGAETIWSCTSCNACVETCPVGIDQLSKIIELRRSLIAENNAPNNLLNTLKNIRSRSNPWGQSPEDREKWAEGLDVPRVSDKPDFEYLYWIGCAGAYDNKSQHVSKTMVKLLNKANVSFAILGKKEKCTGDTARRAGDEGLFQELAIENIETLNSNNVKKIITHCPHCFNTFKNEYPEFGLKDVVVMHHTDVLWELIKEGKLTMTKEVSQEITYHDSCYLGRHNEKYDAPRNILNKIPGVKYIEMENSKEKGTCCGGGGAQLWYEAPGKQINVMRLNEIKESKAKTAASACPYCTIMLDTARTLDNDNPPVVEDISELVAKASL